MDNKVIIIGATSGIGRELAILYARNNWLVGATGRRKELLQSLQAEFPENIITECFDVTEGENIESIKNLTQQLGGLNLLIYNSGYGEADFFGHVLPLDAFGNFDSDNFFGDVVTAHGFSCG